jgi:hypothetical protein
MIFGLMGQGKSSFVNSILSTFAGCYFERQRTASMRETVTKTIDKINLYDAISEKVGIEQATYLNFIG